VPNPQPPDRGVGSNLIQDKRSLVHLSVERECLYASNGSMTDEHNVCGLRELHTRVAFRGGWWDVERLCVCALR
jgi:hypothetical protein